MIALATPLGVRERFLFHGWLSEVDVFARIVASRAVIFPSVWHEPAGLVTLEAAAQGRAVIASRVGGIPEYANRLGNALLVGPNDVEGLAAGMNDLAANAEMAAQLGAAGWRAAREQLTLANHLARLEEAYERTHLGHPHR